MKEFIKSILKHVPLVEIKTAAFPMFKKNIYSQGGVDGILEFIIQKLPEIPKYIIDLGANDGMNGSNSRMLIMNGWKALLIEPYPPAYENCVRLYEKFEHVAIKNIAVSADPQNSTEKINWHGHFEGLEVSSVYVNDLLKQEVSGVVGILKVDLDGMDNEILEEINFTQFQPWFVIAEIDSSKPANLDDQIKIMLKHSYHPFLHIGNVFYIHQQKIAEFLFQNKHTKYPPSTGVFLKG